MPSVTKPASGKQYWRSLEDLAETPEFRAMVQREFPSLLDEVITPSSRRGFLKLMGASLALGGVGLTGCRRWPKELIAPFAHRPEGFIPGTSQHYATVMDIGGVGEGLLVAAYDGRPIKIEGNPAHPLNRGATSVFAQASVLGQYDPERSRGVLHKGDSSTFAAFSSAIRARFDERKRARGASIAILSEASSSITLADVKRRLGREFAEARWYEYEPVTRDHARAGSALAFGRPHRAQYALQNAGVILSLDADVLASHPAWLKHAREFAANRRIEGQTGVPVMSRLYAVESRLSLTGVMADHRLATRAKNVAAVAMAITAKLAEKGVTLEGTPGVPGAAWIDAAFVEAIASDLVEARRDGRGSLVVVGDSQPPELHAFAHQLNQALGNVGRSVTYTTESDAERGLYVDQIRSLAEDLTSGRVDTLVILGGNPAYTAPADLGLAEAMKGAMVVHLADEVNETSELAEWHVPKAHFLEAWSDARGWDGTLSVAQPLIEPFFGGKTAAEVLAVAIGDEMTSSYDLVRRAFRPELGDMNFDRAWRQLLHDGVLADSAFAAVNVTVRPGAWQGRLAELAASAVEGAQVDEVVFIADAGMYDGRFANNAWLQELPDPISKITWDNAALMSPRTAERLGVKPYALVRVAANGRAPVELPAHVVPGHADGTITLALGYGRRAVGSIGREVGFNVYPLRTTTGMEVGSNVTVERARGSYELALTQDHHIMQTAITEWGKQERLPQIVYEANLADYNQSPKKAFEPEWTHFHEFPLVSLWEEHQYGPNVHKWGMSIDLSACIGCSACMIACQAENNVPVVGRDQVMRGREMHWIRVDRYFKFKNVGPNKFDQNQIESVVVQPVTCQHCENAPCEQVCPVAATVHDHDGLNVMVYNRCIGTRYCSNNCPYKVRRFNFYDFHARSPRNEGLEKPYMVMPDQRQAQYLEGEREMRKALFNPEVTVRSVGVMEKCSFCVQRINQAKIDAKNAWVKLPEAEKARTKDAAPHIPDGTVTPACAQSCPTQAIVFGDLNDPGSRVSVLHKSKRQYRLLEYLHTKPRNRYLGRLRNPHPSIVPPRDFTKGHGEGGAH